VETAWQACHIIGMTKQPPTDQEIAEEMQKLGQAALDELRRRGASEAQIQKALAPKRRERRK
jgi:hypothetical protein